MGTYVPSQIIQNPQITGNIFQMCLEENISCIQVVKSFVREKLENERFSKALEDSYQSAKKRVIISSFFGPSIGFIAFSTSLILLWYGGREVILGAISPGELIAFILYATIIAGPMGSFARLYARVQEGIGASKRVFEILDMKGEVRDAPDAKPIPELTGKVEFDDVSFYYREDQEIIKGICFSVEPGQTVALVGPSGAGKSRRWPLCARDSPHALMALIQIGLSTGHPRQRDARHAHQ